MAQCILLNTYTYSNRRQSQLNKKPRIITCSSSQKPEIDQNKPILNTDRRNLLVGSLYALAGRQIISSDAAFATTNTSTNTTDQLQKQLISRVHEFTLDNGLHFLVSERRSAPVVSFHSYVDVGAYDEQQGLTGVAHLLEHAISKGTARIGTTDFRKESALLDAIDDVFYELREAGLEAGGQRYNQQQRVAGLEARLVALQAEAALISSPNAYGALLQKEGAVGLNAQTSHDATVFFCSLPSNKTELWFACESERFRAPVFRDLYQEKKVVLEERRLRVDNSPLGPFQEEFAARSLTNNYRRPVIGYAKDIEGLGRREVASFFAQHYSPASLTIAIVGDVRVDKIRQYAEKYFGGWQSTGIAGAACGNGIGEGDRAEQPLPRPGKGTERVLRMRTRSGPAVLRAYYRPCIKNTAASTAFDVLSDTLSGSRSSRLYRNLVLGNKALTASSFASFPAEKHPSQMAVYGIPVPGVSLEQLDRLLRSEIEDVAVHGPTLKELQRYCKASRLGVLESLQSNSGFASTLTSYRALTGDWLNICRDLREIEELTPQKVVDGVQPYLYEENSFIGYADKA